jgi:hypothetical protein
MTGQCVPVIGLMAVIGWPHRYPAHAALAGMRTQTVHILTNWSRQDGSEDDVVAHAACSHDAISINRGEQSEDVSQGEGGIR